MLSLALLLKCFALALLTGQALGLNAFAFELLGCLALLFKALSFLFLCPSSLLSQSLGFELGFFCLFFFAKLFEGNLGLPR